MQPLEGALPDPLPPVVLLRGVPGIGKRTFLLALAQRLAVQADCQVLGRPFTVSAAREMIEHHQVHPTGEFRVSVADLTGAQPPAQHALLKLLEEPPERSRILLHSDDSLLPTLVSRCFLTVWKPLSEERVREILESLNTPKADEAARHSSGQISRGLTYAYSGESRAAVHRVLAAFEKQDASLLEKILHEVLSTPDGFREQFCASLCDAITHGEFRVPVEVSQRAIALLSRDSRPALRARTAVWTLAGA